MSLRISATNLASYTLCPAKYIFDQIFDYQVNKKTKKISVSKSFHEIVSLVLGSTNDLFGKWKLKPNRNDFISEFRGYATTHENAYLRPGNEYDDLDEIQYLSGNLYDVFIDKFEHPSIPIPLFSEHLIEIDYCSEIKLVAKPDSVIRLRDGSFLIVDWKTGKKICSSQISSYQMQNVVGYLVYSSFFPVMTEYSVYSAVVDTRKPMLYQQKVKKGLVDHLKQKIESLVNSLCYSEFMDIRLDESFVKNVTSIFKCHTGEHCSTCALSKKYCPSLNNAEDFIVQKTSYKLYRFNLKRIKQNIESYHAFRQKQSLSKFSYRQNKKPDYFL